MNAKINLLLFCSTAPNEKWCQIYSIFFMADAELLRDLLNHWIKYTESQPVHSLSDFIQWMDLQIKASEPQKEEFMRKLHQKQMQTGFLLGRLSQFAELWGKLAFQELPIRNFEDYGILKHAEDHPACSKKELAQVLLGEPSTAFEIIKRLIRDGLLEDYTDEVDKRIRRVKLTRLGKRIVQKADIQAGKVAQLLTGHTSDQDLSYLIRLFKTLDSFHTGIYENIQYKKIDDLIN